jgi:hypothetical protein
MKILIASGKKPKDPVIFTHIRNFAKEQGITIEKGMIFTTGYGATNLGIQIAEEGEKAEQFARQLAHALEPSKWCETISELPDVDTFEL